MGRLVIGFAETAEFWRPAVLKKASPIMKLFPGGPLCSALVVIVRAGGSFLPMENTEQISGLRVRESNFQGCARLFGDAWGIISRMDAHEQASWASDYRVLFPCLVAYRKNTADGKETAACFYQLQDASEYSGNGDAAYAVVVQLLCTANYIFPEFGESPPRPDKFLRYEETAKNSDNAELEELLGSIRGTG